MTNRKGQKFIFVLSLFLFFTLTLFLNNETSKLSLINSNYDFNSVTSILKHTVAFHHVIRVSGLCSTEDDQLECMEDAVNEIIMELPVINRTNNNFLSGNNSDKWITFLNTAKITNMNSVISSGTQPKLLLELDNIHWAVFKPKWYSRRWTSEYGCASFDRHNGEIVAYHLSNILAFISVSPTSGRILSMDEDLSPAADAYFNSKIYLNREKRQCIKLSCTYCKTPICGSKESGTIQGSVSLWVNKTFQIMENPWSATCTKKVKQHWLDNPDYCSIVLQNETYASNNLYLDLIDISIFDFLIDNVDRHHLEYEIVGGRRNFILFDNGKSLANPYRDDISILVSLYQCCKIKKSTFDKLHKIYNDGNLDILLDYSMKSDPLYVVVIDEHLYAIKRRLQKVMAVINLCMNKNGVNDVIIKT